MNRYPLDVYECPKFLNRAFTEAPVTDEFEEILDSVENVVDDIERTWREELKEQIGPVATIG
jgi:hypothetical protein